MKRCSCDLSQKHVLNLSFARKRRILFDVGCLIYNLHCNGIYHLDIKPQNFLIDNSKIVVIDFGQSAYRTSYRKNILPSWFICSENFTPPEIMLYQHESLDLKTFDLEKIDVWSFGVLMLYLFHPDFNDFSKFEDVFELYDLKNTKNFTYDNELDKFPNYSFSFLSNSDLIDLITICLNYSNIHRPTFDEILSHKFFKGLSFNVTDNVLNTTFSHVFPDFITDNLNLIIKHFDLDDYISTYCKKTLKTLIDKNIQITKKHIFATVVLTSYLHCDFVIYANDYNLFLCQEDLDEQISEIVRYLNYNLL